MTPFGRKSLGEAVQELKQSGEVLITTGPVQIWGIPDSTGQSGPRWVKGGDVMMACNFLLVALESREVEVDPLDVHCYRLCVLGMMTRSVLGLHQGARADLVICPRTHGYNNRHLGSLHSLFSTRGTSYHDILPLPTSGHTIPRQTA